MKIKLFLLVVVAASILACEHMVDPNTSGLDYNLRALISEASETGDVDHFILPENGDYDAIPQDPRNNITGVKRALGEFLFHETGIALTAEKPEGLETYSCASCHIAEAGFRPGAFQGIADGGEGFGVNGEHRSLSPFYDQTEIDAQGIRPISVLNVAYVPNTFWNGQFGAGAANIGTEDVWDDEENTKVNHLGYTGIESQNIEGLDLHRMLVTEEIAEDLGYKPLFDQAFPEFSSEERYSNLTASLAISAYLRTLLANRAPFQDWLKGNLNAMTVQEKNGASLFFGKAGCVRCHSNPALGSLTFHALGVNDLFMRGALNTSPTDKKNLGRGGFTKRPEDLYKFKVPQLYNLLGTPFYFHGSSKESIKDVVKYFNDAIPENESVPNQQISEYFTPLLLDDEEVDAITAFLSNGLRDPYLERYVPPEIKSGNCFPNNDPVSNQETGCN